MKVFRTIGKRVFRSSRYCVLLLGAVVCSTCAYAVPPDEIDWGWRIKPTFPNEAYGPKTDVNPELTGDNHAILEFKVEINGITVNGVDMMTWDETGQIIDFKVMVRPLKAVSLIHENMGKMLAAQQ
mgnify:CR=1 FL=1